MQFGKGLWTIALLSLAIAILFTACQTTRTVYGHTEAEWQAMSPEQQEGAKVEFEQLVKSREDAKRRQQMDDDMQKTIGMAGQAR